MNWHTAVPVLLISRGTPLGNVNNTVLLIFVVGVVAASWKLLCPLIDKIPDQAIGPGSFRLA
jgi:hypothetical protein